MVPFTLQHIPEWPPVGLLGVAYHRDAGFSSIFLGLEASLFSLLILWVLVELVENHERLVIPSYLNRIAMTGTSIKCRLTGYSWIFLDFQRIKLFNICLETGTTHWTTSTFGPSGPSNSCDQNDDVMSDLNIILAVWRPWLHDLFFSAWFGLTVRVVGGRAPLRMSVSDRQDYHQPFGRLGSSRVINALELHNIFIQTPIGVQGPTPPTVDGNQKSGKLTSWGVPVEGNGSYFSSLLTRF